MQEYVKQNVDILSKSIMKLRMHGATKKIKACKIIIT